MTLDREQIKGFARKAAILLAGLFFILALYNLALQRMALTPEDGRTLIEIARSEMEGRPYSGGLSPRLFKMSPVFVSVYRDGRRVACVGYTKALFPLYESVTHLARGLGHEGEGDYQIVITVFSGYEPLNRTEGVPEGRGILVRREGFEGVVLPFTFQEQNLTDEEALLLAAQKAGFDNYTWEDFQAYTFEAQVFREE